MSCCGKHKRPATPWAGDGSVPNFTRDPMTLKPRIFQPVRKTVSEPTEPPSPVWKCGGCGWLLYGIPSGTLPINDCGNCHAHDWAPHQPDRVLG